MNAAGELFGEQRLMKTIQCCDGLTAADIAKRILEAVDAFVGSAPQSDNIKVVMRRIET